MFCRLDACATAKPAAPASLVAAVPGGRGQRCCTTAATLRCVQLPLPFRNSAWCELWCTWTVEGVENPLLSGSRSVSVTTKTATRLILQFLSFSQCTMKFAVGSSLPSLTLCCCAGGVYAVRLQYCGAGDAGAAGPAQNRRPDVSTQTRRARVTSPGSPAPRLLTAPLPEPLDCGG